MSVPEWGETPAAVPHRLWMGPHHPYTATCRSLPTHPPDYQPLGLHLYFSPPGTPYTNAIHWISAYPSSPAQMSFYLRSFPWMIDPSDELRKSELEWVKMRLFSTFRDEWHWSIYSWTILTQVIEHVLFMVIYVLTYDTLPLFRLWVDSKSVDS